MRDGQTQVDGKKYREWRRGEAAKTAARVPEERETEAELPFRPTLRTVACIGAAVSGGMGGGSYVCFTIATPTTLPCRRLQMCSPSRVDAPPPLLSLPFRRMRHCYSAEVLSGSAACLVLFGDAAQRTLHVSRCVARNMLELIRLQLCRRAHTHPEQRRS